MFLLDWLAGKEDVELVPVGDTVAAVSRSEPELDFVKPDPPRAAVARRRARAASRGWLLA